MALQYSQFSSLNALATSGSYPQFNLKGRNSMLILSDFRTYLSRYAARKQ